MSTQACPLAPPKFPPPPPNRNTSENYGSNHVPTPNPDEQDRASSLKAVRNLGQKRPNVLKLFPILLSAILCQALKDVCGVQSCQETLPPILLTWPGNEKGFQRDSAGGCSRSWRPGLPHAAAHGSTHHVPSGFAQPQGDAGSFHTPGGHCQNGKQEGLCGHQPSGHLNLLHAHLTARGTPVEGTQVGGLIQLLGCQST